MFTIEPTVNEEKLRQLLDEGHESAQLDYKSELEFTDHGQLTTRSLVELAKDLAAMQVDGGYIVIGANDGGEPTDGINLPISSLQRCFDEAELRRKFTKWIPEPFDIRTAIHEIGENRFVVIYIAPRDDGFCIFSADGNYDGGNAFRKGDVYVRHGSASERWIQADITRIIERIVSSRRESWRASLTEDIKNIVSGSEAQTLARGPVATLTWQLEESTFTEVVLELLRDADDIPLRHFIQSAVAEVRRLVHVEGLTSDEFNTVLDRLTCLAAICATYERPQWTKTAIDGLSRIYSIGLNEHGLTKQLEGLDTAELWLAIIRRVMSLGALFVRKEDWRGVRWLVRRPHTAGEFEEYASWIRHGLTMAARAKLLTQVDGDRKLELSLLHLAKEQVIEMECLRPDLPVEDEGLLDSLCQFDFLAGIVAIGDARAVDDGAFYTSFARFYSRRTSPIVVRLIGDEDMRAQLFPYNDADLADAIRGMTEAAVQEMFKFAVWGGFKHHKIREFLNAHPPTDE